MCIDFGCALRVGEELGRGGGRLGGALEDGDERNWAVGLSCIRGTMWPWCGMTKLLINFSQLWKL